MLKRALDIAVSSISLLLFLPLFLLIGVAIRLGSSGSAFFCQERIGRRFRPFFIYKFRTMVQDAPKHGGPITFGDDPRITRIGRLLRRTKLDELPQLINVLKGEMSLVGPRPEVRRYVEMFADDYAEILQVRPGLTDLASIEYHDEAAILGRVEDPETEYAARILPEKIRLAKEYVARSSFLLDLIIIAKTLLVVPGGMKAPARTKDRFGGNS